MFGRLICLNSLLWSNMCWRYCWPLLLHGIFCNIFVVVYPKNSTETKGNIFLQKLFLESRNLMISELTCSFIEIYGNKRNDSAALCLYSYFLAWIFKLMYFFNLFWNDWNFFLWFRDSFKICIRHIRSRQYYCLKSVTVLFHTI